MDQLPVFLNLHGRLCVAVGGGEIALRKITLLDEEVNQVVSKATQARNIPVNVGISPDYAALSSPPSSTARPSWQRSPAAVPSLG